MSETFDLVVIGAGWFGLAAAKVYLELHPSQNILVLESSGSCGGTWAEDRIYPRLKSNNLHGTYEYPDFPMTPEVYGVNPGQHIPGGVLHRYLTNFAKRFGVFSRTRFLTKVNSVRPSGNDTWTLETTSNGQTTDTLRAKRLILATGLTSTPNFPIYPGKDLFNSPYFHAKDFCRNGDTVKTAQNVVVIGGAKSAYDIAYAYADAGALVDMVIRPTGKGPVWIAHPYVDFGLRLEKLLHVRALTCFSPCPWGAEAGYGWFRNFLHGTAVGRWLVDAFWGALGSSVVAQNGYASHPETKKLQPWDSAFWTASGLSILNYDNNVFDMVKAGKIRVHVADVERLTEDTVELTTGESLNAEVVVCATGWKKESSLKFIDFPESSIGLAQSPADQAALCEKADQDILTRFPRLQNQPALRSTPKPSDPLRLYRFIVPPTLVQARNFAMAGMVSTVSTSICAAAQALWISAFFDGQLDRLAADDAAVTEEVMLHTQWGKWRYPCGYGAEFPDFAFDAMTYADLLLNDLGIKVNRKANVFRDFFTPYGPEDFVGLVDEWAEGHGSKVG